MLLVPHIFVSALVLKIWKIGIFFIRKLMSLVSAPIIIVDASFVPVIFDNLLEEFCVQSNLMCFVGFNCFR